MKLNQEDIFLLQELCDKYNVKIEKITKLLETVKEYEFKDRRTGIYDALKEIIKTDIN